MKKISALSMSVLFAVSAWAATPATVSVSGNWSNPLTWGFAEGNVMDTTAPTASFSTSALSLNADVDATITSLVLAASSANTLSASAGKTLTVSGVSTNSTRTLNVNTIANTGTVKLISSANLIATSINANGGTAKLILNNNTYNGTLTINNGASVLFRDTTDANSTATYNGSGSKLIINNGSFTAGIIVCGTLKIESAGSLTSLVGIRTLVSGSYVNGSMTVSGSGVSGTAVVGDDGLTYNTRNFSVRFGNGTNATYATDGAATMSLGSTATIYQTSTVSTRYNDILVNLTVSAAEGALKFQNAVHLAGNGTLNLNSTDAFSQINSSGVVTATQSQMTLNISRHYNDAAVTSGVYAAAVNLNLGADNNWGAFSFGSDAQLTLDLNGYTLVLGEVNTQTGSDGAYKFVLADYADLDYNFKISNMTLTEIEALTFYNTSGTALVENTDYFIIADNTNGGYWINSTIPEPAEWAAIFGALALGLAIYRKRAKKA